MYVAFVEKDTPISTKDKSATGKTTGTTRRCQLAGCTGVRVTVRWPDGQITYPCSKGLTYTEKDGWVIS